MHDQLIIESDLLSFVYELTPVGQGFPSGT
jgi:hypothetical protein